MECFSKEFPIPYIVKINYYTKECEHKIYKNNFFRSFSGAGNCSVSAPISLVI